MKHRISCGLTGAMRAISDLAQIALDVEFLGVAHAAVRHHRRSRRPGSAASPARYFAALASAPQGWPAS